MKLKPGVSTTEFWLAVGAGLVGVGGMAFGMVDGDTATACATILGALYMLLRTAAKNKTGGS